MVKEVDIFDNDEFNKWFNSRPVCIQEVIKDYPPDKEYRLDSPFPVTIYSYDEEENGDISLCVDVHSPLIPRRVFGVSPGSLVMP